MTTEKTESTSTTTELVKRQDIDGTPFTAICVEDQWFLALGKYRLTPPLDSFEECVDQSTQTWERTMQVIQIMIENQPKTN